MSIRVFGSTSFTTERQTSSVSFSLLRQFLPAALEDEGRILGLVLAGENAFLVAVHPHDPFGGLEVGKVPDQLALYKIVVVKNAKVDGQVFILVFFALHDAGQFVLGGQSVGARLSKDEGDIQLFGGHLSISARNFCLYMILHTILSPRVFHY